MSVPQHWTTGQIISSGTKSPLVAPKWEQITLWRDDDDDDDDDDEDDDARFILSQYA